VQNKKELTISGMYVDKMSLEEIFRRLYSCTFTADETALENLRKMLLISKLLAGMTCRASLLGEAYERIKL